MTSVDAIKLSGKVRAIENCAFNVSDANCYREGELGRLLNRVKQLETRLPLQSAKVQIPYENTLGGFAMFNTGITDLAPELYGWYGAPGINIAGETTLFLIGNHFSVHQTRIIAGGVDIPAGKKEMLSRQVMKVTIPKDALRLQENIGAFADATPALCLNAEDKSKEKDSTANISWPQSCCAKTFVQIHVATPYGVTAPVLVPAETVCPNSCPAIPAKSETLPPPVQDGKKDTSAPCASHDCNKFPCPERCPDESKERAERVKQFEAQQAVEKARIKAENDRVRNAQEEARKKMLDDAITIVNANEKKRADELKQYKDAVDKIRKDLDAKKDANGGGTSHLAPNPYAEPVIASPSVSGPPPIRRDSIPSQSFQVPPVLISQPVSPPFGRN